MAEASEHLHRRHQREHAPDLHCPYQASGARAAAGSRRRLAVSLCVTAALMLAEALGGWLSGSLALLSDAGHMLTDVAALGLALLAMVFGSRPADRRRTFGYRRLEVLAAQVNVIALVFLTGWIILEAVERLRAPARPIEVGIMAGVAAAGLAGNVIVLTWLRGDHGLNARSAFLHVLGDAVASVAVLGGAGVIYWKPGLAWLDPVLSMLIALLILWGCGRLFVEIGEILMESAPRHLDLEELSRAMAQAHQGVVAVHDLHVWTISSGLYAMSAHLVIRPDEIGRNDAILTCVEARVRRFGIDHTTFQIESAGYLHGDAPTQ